MPHVCVDDDGLGARGVMVSLRYSTILHRTRSRGGKNKNKSKSTLDPKGKEEKPVANGKERQDPLESFVLRKLEEDFTADGRARLPNPKNEYRARRTAVMAHRMGNDKYEKLIIPGNIFHMRKLGDIAAAALDGEGGAVGARSKAVYWMERELPIQVRDMSTFWFLVPVYIVVHRYMIILLNQAT